MQCLFTTNGYFDFRTMQLRFCYRLFVFKKIFGIDIETHIATAWEEKFALRIGNYVDITLKNKEIIRGYFGTHSLVSTYLEKKDMYLERVISINKKEVEVPTSMWIDGNEIVHIDFISIQESKKHNCTSILVKIYVLLAKIYRVIKKENNNDNL